ncbi:MAG: ketoacyl-ACP synthase III [Lachnospiraceae bacterium]|nr:ketoacyl-ACP synthase III [Lachnospiraceae bacterium]
MAYAKYNNISIEGISVCVSDKWTSLYDISEQDEKTISKFMKRTGVTGRYDAGVRQTSADFCYSAAKELIEKNNIPLNKVGVLVLVTQTADYNTPSTACVLQMRLGLDTNCIAFDVNLGCSGYVNGINIVSSLLNSVDAEYGLLLCGDTTAKEKSQKYRTRLTNSASMLFGDAGSATLLRKKTEADNISILLNTDGEGFKALITPYGGWRNPDVDDPSELADYMDDIEVFNFATTKVPEQIFNIMKINGTTIDDYDCLALHQANLYIMKQIQKKTGFSSEQMLVSIDKFGNTSSASIPTALVANFGDDNSDRVIRIMGSGFGVGLSWATIDMAVNVKNVLPVIQTSEYFEDGYNKIN